jgi:hypothetical protein
MSFTDPENGWTSYVYDTLSSGFRSPVESTESPKPDRRTSLTRPNAVNTSCG